MRRELKFIFFALALHCGLFLFSADTPAPSAASSKKAAAPIKENQPIKAYLTVDAVKTPVEIIGRNEKKILVRDRSKEIQYNLSEVQSVDFKVDLDELKVQELVARKKWDEASALIVKGFLPVFNYLDLYDNNAAEYLLEAGSYMVKSAREDLLKTPPVGGKLSPEIEKKFTNAYKIFKQVEKADWFTAVKTAQLKAVQCLLYLGNLEKATERFEEIGEPDMGDLSYGLYYMLLGSILYEQKKVKDALDAGIKSVCFDTKDLDSFPDALLLCGKCYEDILDPYRARDVYYETASLFQKTEWGDEAFKKLKFIMEKGMTKKPESVDVEKVFFDSEEDVNASVEKFIKEKEEQDRLETERRKIEEEEALEEEKRQEEIKKEQKKQEEEAEKAL